MKPSLLALMLFLGGVTSLAAQSGPAPETASAVVGGRKIILLPPAGFVRCDKIDPVWDRAMEAMVAASNRMIATYGKPDDQAALKAGEPPGYETNFNIQIARNLEAREIGNRTFAQLRDELKEELKKLSATIDQELRKVAATGSKKLMKDFGAEEALTISNTVVLGTFEDSDTSFGFTMAMKVQGGREASRMVAAAIMTPVNGRLLNFYATAPFAGNDDRQWVESSVAAWRDAIVAANPKVEGPSIGFEWGRLGGTALIGAVVGGVIGLIGWLGRKGKRAPQAGGRDGR